MARFPDTQWSLLRRSGEDASTRVVAFSDLARAYQPAILAFFRARLAPADAEDATQAFLAASFEHRWWARADAEAGSFRTFLLVLLRRHLARIRPSAAALPAAVAVEGLADPAPSADAAFDVRFALLLTQRALQRLRDDYAMRGRGPLFDGLVDLLRDPPAHGELQVAASALGIAANTLAVELRRLRSRLRQALRAELGELCCDQAALEAEWGSLEAVLSGI
jgi:DNA-directed RNA polymerase specialized sigma24 family protein